ncbi:HAMP domain-containing protein [Acetobacterium paludosum]|nr:HAMP domain-containing protein [Acetobacterium paludosum]
MFMMSCNPVVINGELKGALNIGYSMSSIQTAIFKNIMMVSIVGLVVFFVLAFILYRVSVSITKPIARINHMIKEMSMGHLGLRLGIDSVDEIGEMALVMDSFADDLQNVVIGTMIQISDGDLSATIHEKDDADEIMLALKQTIKSIRGLIGEATRLSKAGVEGRLHTRGNVELFKGGFRDVVEGINACIIGLGALEEGNRILGLMSHHDFREKMEGQYLGIYSEFAFSINVLNQRLNNIIEIINHFAVGNLQDGVSVLIG